MKERPILFSGAMVRALLDGTKTQTRRMVKPQPRILAGELLCWKDDALTDDQMAELCPYGQPGDRLWVREAFAKEYDYCDHPEMPGAPTEHFHFGWHYRADGEPNRADLEGFVSDWKPSIHMPRAASRITLEVTGVRVERLQDISAGDCWAEGIPASPDVDPVHEYRDLWESINGPDSWTANPWVWVVEFKRLEAA